MPKVDLEPCTEAHRATLDALSKLRTKDQYQQLRGVQL